MNVMTGNNEFEVGFNIPAKPLAWTKKTFRRLA